MNKVEYLDIEHLETIEREFNDWKGHELVIEAERTGPMIYIMLKEYSDKEGHISKVSIVCLKSFPDTQRNTAYKFTEEAAEFLELLYDGR